MSSLNNENTTANSTPLNMTKLNDDNDDNDDKKDIEITDIKDEIKDDIHIINVEVVEHNKKNIDRKRLKKKEENKINTEKRITKRNEKKRKLEEKLIQNTERLQKMKKTKLNK